MAHPEQLLSKLSKYDLSRLVLDYQDKFDSVLKTVKNDICEKPLYISKTVTGNLTKYIKTLERKCYDNEQYLRRECQEKISGLPGNIANNALEETVLDLFSKCIDPVDLSNVEDCHRLKLTMMHLRKLL